MNYRVSFTTAALLSTIGLSAHGQFWINEFVPNTPGSDPATQQVEIRGTPGASFNGSFLSIDSDTATPVIDHAFPISGVLDSNGLLNATINDIENPSNTLVLIDNSITPIVGTQAIVPTLLPATYDAIGIPDSALDEAFLLGAALGGTDFAFTGDEPKRIFRDGNRPNFIYAVNDPSFNNVVNTNGTTTPFASFITGNPDVTDFGEVNPSIYDRPGRVRINEFEPNPFGSDPSTQDIELRGPAGETFTGSIISVEADTAPTIDRVTQFSGTFNDQGLLVVTVNDLENPSFTLVLLDDSIVAPQGTLFDVATYKPATLDAIGVPDIPLDEANLLGEELGGIDFVYTGDEPKLIFRDGVDVGLVYALNDPPAGVAIRADGTAIPFGDFTLGNPELTSYGVRNPTVVPEPTSLALLGLGGLMVARRRR